MMKSLFSLASRMQGGRKNLPITAANFMSHMSDGRLPFPLTGTCKALIFHETGEPANVVKMENSIEYVSQSSIEAATAVHVRMLAAPVNPADINQIQGTYPLGKSPEGHIVAGNEGVGIVVAIGDKVTSMRVGDHVIPRGGTDMPLGTWREQLITDEDAWQVIPSDIPIPTAASLLVNPPTAYRLLRDFETLKPGDVVVQNGANSAVGRALIQLAKHWGIRTVNIVRDRPGYTILESDLRALGADIIVKAEFFAQADVQQYIVEKLLGGNRPRLAFNCVGGMAAMDLANFLAEGGTLVTYGGMARKGPIVSVSSLIFRDIRFVGFWMTRWYRRARQELLLESRRHEMMQEIIQMFQDKKLHPPYFSKIDFHNQEAWKQALQYYSSSKSEEGKIAAQKPLFIFRQ